MVVGARYGSIDAEADKSVTNLEFVEARARGVPTYAFVSKDVLAQYPVWKENPEANFSNVVDTARVFQFVDSFREGGDVWTFPFDSAEDVVNTLRQQFAFLVQDALELRQKAHGHEQLQEELKGDALMLALHRDEYWEVRLFATVLEEELDRRATLRRDIEYGLARDDVTSFVDTLDIPSWVMDRLHELRRFAMTATSILNDYLAQALGEVGEPGDPIEIASAARRLAQVWEDCAQWTLRCRAIRVDDGAEHVVDLLSTLNEEILGELWSLGTRSSLASTQPSGRQTLAAPRASI